MEQTVNTFHEGILMDPHPMVQSRESLTDALNATMVTMNGNEVILQNDMGNRRIDEAYLPAGYEPVGMKEYGGIIYIAAYNPITRRGLVGSFPSPDRIKSVRAKDVTPLELSFPDIFINLDNYVLNLNKVKILKNDSVLYKLSPDNSYIHVGDKFILYGNKEEIEFYKLDVSNFFNTEGNKIKSPKNKLYTFLVGVINSLNTFMNITNKLFRFNESGELMDESGKTLDYILNDQSFLQFNTESSNTENRNKKIWNTYSSKLISPLYLKINYNHIQSIDYNIKGEISNQIISQFNDDNWDNWEYDRQQVTFDAETKEFTFNNTLILSYNSLDIKEGERCILKYDIEGENISEIKTIITNSFNDSLEESIIKNNWFYSNFQIDTLKFEFSTLGNGKVKLSNVQLIIAKEHPKIVIELTIHYNCPDHVLVEEELKFDTKYKMYETGWPLIHPTDILEYYKDGEENKYKIINSNIYSNNYSKYNPLTNLYTWNYQLEFIINSEKHKNDQNIDLWDIFKGMLAVKSQLLNESVTKKRKSYRVNTYSDYFTIIALEDDTNIELRNFSKYLPLWELSAPSYRNIDIQFEYSLDGGKSWDLKVAEQPLTVNEGAVVLLRAELEASLPSRWGSPSKPEFPDITYLSHGIGTFNIYGLNELQEKVPKPVDIKGNILSLIKDKSKCLPDSIFYKLFDNYSYTYTQEDVEYTVTYMSKIIDALDLYIPDELGPYSCYRMFANLSDIIPPIIDFHIETENSIEDMYKIDSNNRRLLRSDSNTSDETIYLPISEEIEINPNDFGSGQIKLTKWRFKVEEVTEEGNLKYKTTLNYGFSVWPKINLEFKDLKIIFTDSRDPLNKIILVLKNTTIENEEKVIEIEDLPVINGSKEITFTDSKNYFIKNRVYLVELKYSIYENNEKQEENINVDLDKLYFYLHSKLFNNLYSKLSDYCNRKTSIEQDIYNNALKFKLSIETNPDKWGASENTNSHSETLFADEDIYYSTDAAYSSTSITYDYKLSCSAGTTKIIIENLSEYPDYITFKNLDSSVFDYIKSVTYEGGNITLPKPIEGEGQLDNLPKKEFNDTTFIKIEDHKDTLFNFSSNNYGNLKITAVSKYVSSWTDDTKTIKLLHGVADYIEHLAVAGIPTRGYYVDMDNGVKTKRTGHLYHRENIGNPFWDGVDHQYDAEVNNYPFVRFPNEAADKGMSSPTKEDFKDLSSIVIMSSRNHHPKDDGRTMYVCSTEDNKYTETYNSFTIKFGKVIENGLRYFWKTTEGNYVLLNGATEVDKSLIHLDFLPENLAYFGRKENSSEYSFLHYDPNKYIYRSSISDQDITLATISNVSLNFTISKDLITFSSNNNILNLVEFTEDKISYNPGKDIKVTFPIIANLEHLTNAKSKKIWYVDSTGRTLDADGNEFSDKFYIRDNILSPWEIYKYEGYELPFIYLNNDTNGWTDLLIDEDADFPRVNGGNIFDFSVMLRWGTVISPFWAGINGEITLYTNDLDGENLIVLCNYGNYSVYKFK